MLRIKILLLTALFLISTSLFAHDTPYQSLQKRVNNAEIIFEGEVLSSESTWSNNKKVIYTRSSVRIDKVFKGTHSQSTIIIYTKGGLTDGKFHMHSHAAFLTTGYKGIFFGVRSPYPHFDRSEFDGIRLLYEESGFIQFTDNSTGIKAFDNHHNYFQRIESVYDSIYLSTRQPYVLKNAAGAFSFSSVPCPPDPEPEITFSFENIEITGFGQYLELDIMAKSSQNGTAFASAELSIKYPTAVFDHNVVQEGLVEVQREQVIQDNNYVLTISDAASDEFKIATSALQNNTSVYALSTVKEKLCHVKLTISNIANVPSLSGDDFTTIGDAHYYCGKGLYPFKKVKIVPVTKITTHSKPNASVGLTYTFENIQIVGNNNDVLSIDIYASSAEPTSFAGGIVEIMFNDDALSFDGSSTGFGFQRGEIIQNTNVYTFQQLNAVQPNIIEIQIESFNVQNLYLLDQTPKKFCSIFLPIDDCSESVGLEFLEDNMQNGSNHYTGIDPIPWENYDPITANDTDNSTICGCTNAPNIVDFDPKNIPAGMGQILTITGTNFGTYDADVCKVIFPDGDEGGASFSQAIAEEGDIINWSDTEIRLYVPSTTGGSGSFKNPACSGRIKVVNDCGDDQTGINDLLRIPYAVFNVRGNPNEPANLLTIANVSNGNGVEFRYASNVPTFARNAFEAALAEWCAVTNISFTISSQDVSISQGVPGDNLNTITWEDLTIGSGGGQGALVVGSSYFEQCQNPVTGRTGLFMKELDLIIDKDASVFQDVKNVMLHELGHAHMLQHSYDPDAPITNNYLMYFSLTGVNVATIKGDDATGANMVFSNSAEVLGGSGCAVPISQGGCGNTNAVNDLLASNLIKVTPNPNTGSFALIVSDGINGNIEWKIQDIAGHQIMNGSVILSGKQINIDTRSTLTSGTYIFTLLTEQGIIAKRLVIHK